MQSDDEVRLVFSVAEKIAFLERHGYTVNRKHVEREQHLHGSRYVPFLTVETTATKGEITMELHRAFARVLLDKILEL